MFIPLLTVENFHGFKREVVTFHENWFSSRVRREGLSSSTHECIGTRPALRALGDYHKRLPRPPRGTAAAAPAGWHRDLDGGGGGGG
jgi:hypothetical protein